MGFLRKRDNPDYKYTIAMMGYGPEDKSALIELTCNYGVTEYNKGNAYAQIAIGTDDVYRTAEAVKLCGGKITREAAPLPGINTKITACLHPDGWKTMAGRRYLLIILIFFKGTGVRQFVWETILAADVERHGMENGDFKCFVATAPPINLCVGCYASKNYRIRCCQLNYRASQGHNEL